MNVIILLVYYMKFDFQTEKESKIQEYNLSQESLKYKKYARVIALLFELHEQWSFEMFLYTDKELKSRREPKKVRNPDFVNAILTCYDSDSTKNKAFNYFKNIKLSYKSFDTSDLQAILTQDRRKFESINKFKKVDFEWQEPEDILWLLSYCAKLDSKDRTKGLKSIPWLSNKSLSNFKDIISEIWLDQHITNEEIMLFQKILWRRG